LHFGGATDEAFLTPVASLEHLRGVGHAKLAEPTLLPASAKRACATCRSCAQAAAGAAGSAADSAASNPTTSQSGRAKRARLTKSPAAQAAGLAKSTAAADCATADSPAADSATADSATAKSRITATASDLSEDRRSRHERSGDQSRDIAGNVTHRRSRLGL
jgi:hypothetical protein